MPPSVRSAEPVMYDWLGSQRKYAKQEASKLKNTPWRDLKLVDKLRNWGLGPLLILPYTLLVKGVILDGKPGLAYARQRLIAEFEIWKARFRPTNTN